MAKGNGTARGHSGVVPCSLCSFPVFLDGDKSRGARLDGLGAAVIPGMASYAAAGLPFAASAASVSPGRPALALGLQGSKSQTLFVLVCPALQAPGPGFSLLTRQKKSWVDSGSGSLPSE